MARTIGKRAYFAAIVGGVFAGLTTYTFLSGRGFPVVVVLFLAYAALTHREQLVKRWRVLLLYSVLMIALSMPLFAYLAMHPELDFHVQDLGTRSWLAQGSIDGLIRNVADTLGMFTVRGDMNWVRNIPGRRSSQASKAFYFILASRCACGAGATRICFATHRRRHVSNAQHPHRRPAAIHALDWNPPRLDGSAILPTEWMWTRIEQWASNQKYQWRVSVASALLVSLIGISILARTATDMFQVWIDNPGVYWMTLAFYDGVGKYVNASADSTPLNYVMDVYTDWRKHNIQRTVQRPDVAMRYSVKTAFVFPNDSRGGRIAFQFWAHPPMLCSAHSSISTNQSTWMRASIPKSASVANLFCVTRTIGRTS